MSTSHFAQLVAQLSKPRPGRRASRQTTCERPATKTGVMRDYLRTHGKATAADLAMEADVGGNTGLVWALLKADIAKGCVELRGHVYHWNVEFDEREHAEIQAAIRTLRAAGYQVTRRSA